MAKDSQKKSEKKEDEVIIVNINISEHKPYMLIELCLNGDKLEFTGFINKVIARSELKEMLMAEPKEIYPVAVTKFYEYLDPEKSTTKVTCIDHRSHKSYRTMVDLEKLAKETLKLRDTGRDMEEAGHKVFIAELKQYNVK